MAVAAGDRPAAEETEATMRIRTGLVLPAQPPLRICSPRPIPEGDPMDTVTSSDGTAIAFDRLGEGPAVIMIGRGPTDRSANAPLAELLAKRFTVVNYLLSSDGRRLGAVSDGGRLADGTAARSSKRARLYPALHQQASDRGIQVVFGKRLVSAEPHPRRRQRQR
jgi:hypothetical protein